MRNCYADPTANTAIANVDRERRREEKRKKLLIQREYENTSGIWNGKPGKAAGPRERIPNNISSSPRAILGDFFIPL